MNYQSITTFFLCTSLCLLSACTPNLSQAGCNNFACQRDTLLKNARASYRRPSKSKNLAKNVKFSKIKFTNSDNGDGLWTGFVHGSGLARLRINFIENGAITTSRYMGSVKLEPNDDPTFFRFKSQLPESGLANWKIVNY